LHIFQDGGQDDRREYEFNVPRSAFRYKNR